MKSKDTSTNICENVTCLLCKSTRLIDLLNLSSTPIANDFLTPDDSLLQIEYFFPLGLKICLACQHIQISQIVDPGHLFRSYPYLSNSNKSTAERFQLLAEQFTKEYYTGKDSFALEIGSNDGSLLSELKNLGWNVLGVDPAALACSEANENGVETINEFFDLNLAVEILSAKGHPDLIIANNVFAHSNQMNNIFEGISLLLGDDSIFVMEFSYVLDVYEKLLFDTIYHEHMSYHAVNPLLLFLASHNLKLVDVVRFDAHGGSLRVYVRKLSSSALISQAVSALASYELSINLFSKTSWEAYQNRILLLSQNLKEVICRIRNEGFTITGYGVPAKFTTLFHSLGLEWTAFNSFVDDNQAKIGLNVPGTSIKIQDASTLSSVPADFILLFSWNYSSEIIEKIISKNFCRQGIIIPLPELKIIGIDRSEKSIT
jgi:hypothetical protein